MISTKSINLREWEACGMTKRRVTQLWRNVKKQPKDHYWSQMPSYKLHLIRTETTRGSCVQFEHKIKENSQADYERQQICPYGATGTKLVCKETYSNEEIGQPVIYRASATREQCAATNWYDRGFKWHSACTMPPNLARFTPYILDIRVMRPCDVSEEDADKSGAWFCEKCGSMGCLRPDDRECECVEETLIGRFHERLIIDNGFEALKNWYWVLDL
jgi:hypothetical protein